MQILLRLLAEITDGRFHSYCALQQRLSISRDQLEGLLQDLVENGTSFVREQETGVRLAQQLEWLDEDRIRAGLPTDLAAGLSALDIVPATASTNDWLLTQAETTGPRCCMTEFQYAGKGRRGRVWLNPPAANIALSIAWPWNEEPEKLQGFTLAVGAAVAASVQRLGGHRVGVKWPNDLVFDGRKLGGILVETRGAPGRVTVVTGIGLNVFVADHDPRRFGQPICDLTEVCGGRPGRNEVTAVVLTDVLRCFQRFRQFGFLAWKDEFQRFDASRNKAVEVVLGKERISGAAGGVNDVGQLIVHTATGARALSAGEISLRQAG